MTWGPYTLYDMEFSNENFDDFKYADPDTGLPKAFEKFIQHAANNYLATSTTSLAVGTGSKSLTCSTSKPYAVGTPLRIARTSDPTGAYMEGIVTSYDGVTGALVITIYGCVGSGTYTDWTINIGGSTLSVSSPVTILQGGTGSTTQSGARTNLGLGTVAVQDADTVAFTGGTIDGVTIGATTPAAATLTKLTLTGSTIATNGIYLPAANTVGISSNSLDVARFASSGSAVNYLTFTSRTTGNGNTIFSGGSDTNCYFDLIAKGSGTVRFCTGGVSGTSFTVQGYVSHTASAVNTFYATGGATGNPVTYGATGSNTDVGMNFVNKGAGDYSFKTGAGSYTQLFISGSQNAINYYSFQGSTTGNPVQFYAGGSDTNIQANIRAKAVANVNIGTTTLGDLWLFAPVASAVNGLTFTAAVATGSPSIATTGSDTNIDLTLSAKGSGVVKVNDSFYVTGNVGIGTAPDVTYALKISQASSNQIYLESTGSNWCYIKMNCSTSGQSVYNEYRDAGTVKWLTGKAGSNDYIVYDSVNSKYFLAAVAGGSLYLGSLQNVTVGAAGGLAVGGAITNNIAHSLNGTLSWAGDGFGCYSSITYQSNVTAAYNFYSIANTQATTWTLGTLAHFYAAQPTFGAGSTVTNQYGFAVENSLTGATNNYGFYSNIASGSNRWNFYANGTAQNYFAGTTTFGKTSTATTTAGVLLSNTAVHFAMASGQYIVTNRVASDAGTVIDFRYGDASKGSISITSTNTAFNTSSDPRLKDGIQAISKPIMDTLRKIPVYSLYYKDDPNKTRIIGWLSTDLEDHMPECVTGTRNAVDENGVIIPQLVDYSKMTPALLGGLKELDARQLSFEERFSTLEAKNTAYEDRFSALEARVATMEATIH